IHDWFASFRLGGSDKTTDDCNATSFDRDSFCGFAIMGDERRALDQIAWRVAANRKLGKQNQASPGSLSLMGEVNDLGCVAGEVSDRGIDLSQRYLHSSSVKRREQHAKSSWRSAGILPAVVRASRPHASNC